MPIIRQTVIKFFLLFFSSILLLFSIISLLYYHHEKENLINNEIKRIELISVDLIDTIKHYHQNKTKKIDIVTNGYQVAFYDADYKIIKSNIINSQYSISKIFILQPYFLGIKYIKIQTNLDVKLLDDIIKKIATIVSMGFIFIIIVSIFLLRIITKPLKDSFTLIDNFIKDTTHEIATPISTISMTIKNFDKKNLNENQLNHLNRINYGVINLNNLYNELSFATFQNRLKSHNEIVYINNIIDERVKFFEPLYSYKKIKLSLDLEATELFLDKNRFIRVIDNLLSNAIKYNKIGGQIDIKLHSKRLSIKDSGYGIDNSKLNSIFDRFSRASNFGGGFGIGLHSVKSICDEYNIKISVVSKLNEGSEFILQW
jgi:two-component system OmpR family sensor kinase